jgi:hypothetical protein
MKKEVICLGSLALVLLLVGGVSAKTIPDGPNDVFHWRWDDDLKTYSWEQEISDKPNIDIIQIGEQVSNDQLELSLKVDGAIEEDDDVWYWLWYNTTDAYYYLSYTNGSGDFIGLGTGTNYSQFTEGEVTVSDDTIFGTIDIIGGGAVIKFWGWAANGYSMSGGNGEYWQDWAPEDYAPDIDNGGGSENGGDGDGDSTPGFEFMMIAGAIVILAFAHRRRRK